MADLGVLDACKTFAPDIDVHMSTQTGITNWAAARAAYNMGAKRVVLAREMTLQDIATLRDKTPPELEIEAFVHGAMCMSVSGRCLLSNYMAGRDANRGQCAQPCRWKYYLSEETRPGQLYEIGENEDGSYILNANDLCTAPLPRPHLQGGRGQPEDRRPRQDLLLRRQRDCRLPPRPRPVSGRPDERDFELPEEVLAELTRTSHRHYSPGFYFGREQARQATDSATYIREWEFVGTVDGWERQQQAAGGGGGGGGGGGRSAGRPPAPPPPPLAPKEGGGGGGGGPPPPTALYPPPPPPAAPWPPAGGGGRGILKTQRMYESNRKRGPAMSSVVSSKITGKRISAFQDIQLGF